MIKNEVFNSEDFLNIMKGIKETFQNIEFWGKKIEKKRIIDARQASIMKNIETEMKILEERIKTFQKMFPEFEVRDIEKIYIENSWEAWDPTTGMQFEEGVFIIGYISDFRFPGEETEKIKKFKDNFDIKTFQKLEKNGKIIILDFEWQSTE